jgi:hypothetical protein
MLDQSIREFADSLFSQSIHEIDSQFKKDHQAKISELVRRGGFGSQQVVELESEMIGKKMRSRLITYQQAFETASVRPSIEDLTEIWSIVESTYATLLGAWWGSNPRPWRMPSLGPAGNS